VDLTSSATGAFVPGIIAANVKFPVERGSDVARLNRSQVSVNTCNNASVSVSFLLNICVRETICSRLGVTYL
jgi:hypothetical protein